MTDDAQTLLSALTQSQGYCELQMWEQAWNVLEDLPDHLRSTAEALQARVPALIGLGEHKKALILAGSLSAAFPERPDAWFRLTCAEAAAGHLTAAKAVVAKCIGLDAEWRLRIVDEPSFKDIF